MVIRKLGIFGSAGGICLITSSDLEIALDTSIYEIVLFLRYMYDNLYCKNEIKF